MSEVTTRLIVNCETGEATVVELTPEELAERDALREQALADQAAREVLLAAEAEAKASAQAKLAALGLSPEEIIAITK